MQEHGRPPRLRVDPDVTVSDQLATQLWHDVQPQHMTGLPRQDSSSRLRRSSSGIITILPAVDSPRHQDTLPLPGARDRLSLQNI